MSDDLISRKALLEEIANSFSLPILKRNLRPEHIAVLEIKEIIKNMPTAFDEEKVTNDLLNASICSAPDEDSFVELEEAIEIVKKGGV